MMSRFLRRRARSARLLIAVVACVVSVAVAPEARAVPQSVPRGLESAVAAFEARDYQRAATLARVAADRSQGAEREGARYLEGYALYRSGSLDAAASALRVAAASTDRYIAGQANITLGSVELERKNHDAAGHAYRRAASFLDGSEAKRAHSYAARCFDEAGLSSMAESERVAAGEPRVLVAPAPAPVPAAAPAERAKPIARPTPAPDRTTVTERDKPAAPPASIAPVRYAIQVGAFSTAARASEVAGSLRAKCIALGVGAPRVVARQGENGSTLHIVQIGSFPNKMQATQISTKLPKGVYRVELYIGEGVAGHTAD